MRYSQFGIKWLLVVTLVVAAYLAGRNSLQPILSKTRTELNDTQEKLETISRLNVALSPQIRPRRITLRIVRLDESSRLKGFDAEALAEKLNLIERIDRIKNQSDGNRMP